MTQLLLCTDLDRTLLPNGPQPESEFAREYFCSLVSREEVTLVYVTGRHKELVQEAVDSYKLPLPDYVIADVGSTIYRIKHNEWIQCQQWDTEISSDWMGKTHNDIHKILVNIEGIRLQEPSKQNTHKLSYYVSLNINYDHLISNISKILKLDNIKAALVWSIDDTENIGLLDILPANANKRHAIEFLMEKLNYEIEETVFSGDSGNDIAVIASPIQSVIVANASNTVKEEAINEAIKNGQQDSVYFAKGGYLNMNGNYSAGIIEGVVHYIPDIHNWISGNHE